MQQVVQVVVADNRSHHKKHLLKNQHLVQIINQGSKKL
jgi:hypothetical protein